MPLHDMLWIKLTVDNERGVISGCEGDCDPVLSRLGYAKIRGIALTPRPSGVLNHAHPVRPPRPASVLRPPREHCVWSGKLSGYFVSLWLSMWLSMVWSFRIMVTDRFRLSPRPKAVDDISMFAVRCSTFLSPETLLLRSLVGCFVLHGMPSYGALVSASSSILA